MQKITLQADKQINLIDFLAHGHRKQQTKTLRQKSRKDTLFQSQHKKTLIESMTPGQNQDVSSDVKSKNTFFCFPC